MDNFQSILIVIGIIAIVAVSIHGFFVHKKDKNLQLKAVTERDRDILAKAGENDNVDKVFAPQNTNDLTNLDDMYFSARSNEGNNDLAKSLHIKATSVKNDHKTAQNNDQLQIENDGNKPPEEKNTNDVFIFNVVAKDGGELCGHELLQYFLTSGFRFGEMSIFHRHEHSDGTGPILFSIANMMMPGTFDLDSIEQFKSEGVSFFLTAPNEEINIKASFKMMLTAVEIMAEDFDCIVLNSQRKEFTEEQFIGYQNRLAKYDVARPVLSM